MPPPFSETLQRPASALYSARGPRPNPVDAPAVLREPRRHLLEQGGPLKFGRREVAGCARPPTRELEGVQLSPRVAKAGFAGPLWQPASARPAWRGRPSLAAHAGVDAAALGARRAPEPEVTDGEVAAADTAERIAAASAARERQQRKRAEVAALASAVASLRGALEHGAPPAFSEALEDARLDLERRYAAAAGLDATPRRRGGSFGGAASGGLSDAEMRLGRAAISTGLSSSRR